jgi:hypothetical protein
MSGTAPFPAVHGPATSLRAKQAVDLIFLCIAFSAVAVAALISDKIVSSLVAYVPEGVLPVEVDPPCILRC